MRIYSGPNERRNKFEGGLEYYSFPSPAPPGRGAVFFTSMPSPATHLRAPLLWLLLPVMAGLTAAKLWPLPTCGVWPLVLAAGALSVFAAWLALR